MRGDLRLPPTDRRCLMSVVWTVISFFAFLDGIAKAAEPLKIIREAFESSRQALKSGIGEGTFEKIEWVRVNSEKNPRKFETQANVKVYFARPKFHIRLEYSKEPLKRNKRIIIYDGTGVFTTRFSDHITVTGGETEAYDVNKTSTGMVMLPGSTGFPWDPTRLPSAIANISWLLDNYTRDDLGVRETPMGNYFIRYKPSAKHESYYVLEFEREYGYNLSSWRYFIAAEGESSRSQVKLTWKEQDGIWYIASIEKEFNLGGHTYRDALHYERFEVNAEVPPEMFTMAALEAPGGSRLIDHREQAAKQGVAERIHYVPVEDKQMEQKLDSLAAQLAVLPTKPPPRRGQPTNLAPNLSRIWLVAANVLLLAIIAALLLWRRRNTGKSI